MVWSYRAHDTESVDQEFYASLSRQVTDEIARRARGGRLWVGREMQVRVGNYVVQARLTNIDPQLATTVSDTTMIQATYVERPSDAGQDVSAFIAEIIRYPNDALGASYDLLVGLDDIKRDLTRKLTLLLYSHYLEGWAAQHYAARPPTELLRTLRSRYPLVLLEGEVGSGKTALARSIGHVLARQMKQETLLYIVNAQVRGGGHVGELTQNITRAFEEVEQAQEREQIPVLVLIDEADALAQVRGGRQTHHEDDAGVNTLIQRIDRLRGKPVAVVFATNLSRVLDPAIVRRAIARHHFDRPTTEQRAEVFRRLLSPVEITEDEIKRLAALTEPRALPGDSDLHRYTYSDLSQRIIPYAVETAVYAQQPLTFDHLAAACGAVPPTPEASRADRA